MKALQPLYNTYPKKLILLSIGLILIFVSPYFILGVHSHMPVLDNMDSNIAWYRVLVQSGTLFAPLNTKIPQIINGLPRADFYSQFYGYVLLNTFLPPVAAYGVNQLIVRVFAFLGMYLLLKDHVLKKSRPFITILTALAFALQPFWPSGMLSQLGMPLALWAFLNVRGRTATWKSWLVIILLPFYSTFVLGFFFFLTAVGIFWIVDIIRKKQINWPFFFSIALMTVIYLGIEYRLVFSLILPHEPTSRSDFVESTLTFSDTLVLFLKNFFLGHRQDQTLHTPIMLPVIIAAIVIIWRKSLWKKEQMLLWLMALYTFLSLWYAFWFFEGWQPLKNQFNILTTFNFSRFHYLHPITIYTAFAIALKIIFENRPKGKSIVKWAMIIQLVILFGSNDQIIYQYLPSFQRFYAVDQFQKIEDYIGKPQEDYRVASIGLHPAIAQYNGFYTLDTYNNFYPLSYKRKFRKIIAPELAKNETIRSYFDDWGSRAYIFTDELGKHYIFRKDSTVYIKNLDLNIKQFKAMGGQYIFSSVPIAHPEQTGLTFEKAFDSKTSAWTIYLYSVIDTGGGQS